MLDQVDHAERRGRRRFGGAYSGRVLPALICHFGGLYPMGWTPAGLGLLCNAEHGVTATSALLLATYLGNGPKGAELFMALQAEFNLYHERKRLKAVLAKIKPAAH